MAARMFQIIYLTAVIIAMLGWIWLIFAICQWLVGF
jgi:hypothetical protein